MAEKEVYWEELFKTIGEKVKGLIEDKIQNIKEEPRECLKIVEKELASYLDEVFILLVPDYIVTKENANALNWIKATLNIKSFLDNYNEIKEYWPTFVFPHFRGSIVSGQRETGFIISERALRESQQTEKDSIYEFLKIFHQVYVHIFGLGNTITEKVAKTLDNPNTDIFRSINRDKKVVAFIIEIDEEKSNISWDEINNYIILNIKIGKIICDLLVGKKAELIDAFINTIHDGFKEKELEGKRRIDAIIERMNQIDNSLLKRLILRRNFAKLSLLEEYPYESEFLIKLCDFFLHGEIKEITKAEQPSNEENKEIDSILTSFQALLIYCSVLGEKNKTVGLFYIPSLSNSENRSVYPRCSAACFWKSRINEEIIKIFCKIFNSGYARIQGLIEDRLYDARKGEIKKVDKIGEIKYGKVIFRGLKNIFTEEGVELLITHYILAMEVGKALSEISEHEGDILEFALIFGRKYHVETIFPSVYEIKERERQKFVVSISEDRKKITGIPNVVSRILGHYAIFSRANVGLFACFDYKGKQESINFTDIVLLEELPGNKIAIRQLASPVEFSTAEKIKNVTKYHPEILSIAASGIGQIRVFHSGEEILEYNSKEWILLDKGYNEFVKNLSDMIKSKFGAQWNEENTRVLTEVIRLISEMPGKGASFIICDHKNLEVQERMSIPASEMIEYVEGQKLLRKDKLKLLFQVAIMDGATLIDSNTLRVYGRRQLPIFDWRYKKFEEKWASGGELEWPNYEKIYRWGIRHISALGITAKDESALAIVISSDGPITVFEKGKGIDKLGYPPIKTKI